MFKLVAFMCFGVFLLSTLNLYRNLRVNIAKAKRIGLPYEIVPWHHNGFWYVFSELVTRILIKFEFGRRWKWVKLSEGGLSWKYLRDTEDEYGDNYVTVSPFEIYLRVSNAEINNQITTRRNDFLKPIERYGSIDIFGKNILSSEGLEWKRHKKITATSFSEKSNRLVFEESLRQADSMITFWQSQGANTVSHMKVDDASHDAATLSFHVISAAGFGVPQLWPGESVEKLQGNEIPGFTFMLPGSHHSMALKDSLIDVLRSLLWFMMFKPENLKHSPLRGGRYVYKCWVECSNYFSELLELRKKQMYQGENEKGTMDLLGPMIKASEEAPADSKSTDVSAEQLSKTEIIGNSFIFLLAGHETSANSIYFSIIQLAMAPHYQRLMQTDVDNIVGSKPSSEWSYQADMPRLYNSMVGAVLNEQLRLIPAIPNVPKTANGDQTVHVDGEQLFIPNETFIHLNVIGTNRNPRYWPSRTSTVTGKEYNSNDFIPERWLPANRVAEIEKEGEAEDAHTDGLEKASFETSSSNSLIKPAKGTFLAFSEGARACPGRRFAQVEITAVLSAIFQKYSVELDVSQWASDEDVARMGVEEKRVVYQKAIDNAQRVIRRLEQTITLKLAPGDKVPIRFVERGSERFADVV